MYSIDEVLKREYFGNTVQEYLIAAGILIVGLLIITVFKRLILRGVAKIVRRTESTLDDLIFADVKRFLMPILGTALVYWSINTLALSVKAEKVITVAVSVVIAFFIIRLISSIINIALTAHVSKQPKGGEKVKQIGSIMLVINIVIWILGTIFLFDNLGYNVSAILTGVGIGGIAVALAAQNIIGDLFNYFVIFFDKPFEVGDAIRVNDKNGTVEYIGLKTTRLRSISGEQIVISNSDLTKSWIHNFKRQENRRVEYNFNVLYRTPIDKLKRIPGIVREIIERTPNTRFDRAHVALLSDYGLTVSVVFFITIPDYQVYMDAQQAINLQIIERFQQEGITFQIREDKEFKLPEAGGGATKSERPPQANSADTETPD